MTDITHRVFLAGDSTMSFKPDPENPERGWGMYLSEFFSPEVGFLNHAVNGRSTKSFLDQGRWDEILKEVQGGETVFIQFGHNDNKPEDPSRYTDADTEYRENLQYFVNSARERGAFPLLFTSICRRKFDNSGRLLNTHGRYPEVVREISRTTGTPLVDMEQRSREILQSMGSEDSKSVYLWVPAGELASLPEGKADDTHFSEKGARLMAEIASDEIGALNIPLSEYRRTN